MKSLFKMRKFKVALCDLVTSLILYFGAKYLAPDIVADIKFVIGAMQPVWALVIWGIAHEDGKLKGSMGVQFAYNDANEQLKKAISKSAE